MKRNRREQHGVGGRTERAGKSTARRLVVGLIVVFAMAGALFYYLRTAPNVVPARTEKEPTGFANARFGASVEEVKNLYPRLEPLTKSLGSAVVEGPLVTRWVLWQQKTPGLPHPTNVELRFWKGRLWVVIIYFGENSLQTVIDSLTARYGPPRGNALSAVWTGAKSTVIVAGRAKWYSIHDNVISKEAQTAFIEDLRRNMRERTMRGQGRSEAVPLPDSRP